MQTTPFKPVYQPPVEPETDEVSLGQIAGFLRRYFLILLAAGVLFGLLGYGVTRFMSVEYTATAKILPEFNGMGAAQSLGGLASLAGLSVGQASETIRPELYPDIIQSKTFLIKALTTPLTASNQKEVLLMEYFDYGASPLTPAQVAQSDSLIVLTKEQEWVMKDVASRFDVAMDRLTGVLSVRVIMPDPVLAASCSRLIVNYFTEFVLEYRTTKEAKKVNFLTSQVRDNKQKYQRAEVALGAYRDRNRNQFTNVARIEEQRLQNDFMQYQSLYGELTRQLESARLQAQEEAPVLKVLEPPMIPNEKSSPKTMLITIGAALFGVMQVGLYLLLFKK